MAKSNSGPRLILGELLAIDLEATAVAFDGDTLDRTIRKIDPLTDRFAPVELRKRLHGWVQAVRSLKTQRRNVLHGAWRASAGDFTAQPIYLASLKAASGMDATEITTDELLGLAERAHNASERGSDLLNRLGLWRRRIEREGQELWRLGLDPGEDFPESQS